MTLVVDASVVVAGLVDDSAVGQWADSVLATRGLAAPAQMPFEAANILRRVSLRASVTVYDATYVAVAEALGVPLATLDLRLSRSPCPRCPFRTFADDAE